VIARRRRRASGSPTRRSGLSLLEVLVALAIFLIALVAVFGLVNYGADRGAVAAMKSAGTRLAQSKLAEVEAGVIPVSGGGSGQFDGDDAAWNWSVEPSAASVPNVYSVTVRVSREYRGRQFEVVLTQMVFDPTQMGTAVPAQPPATSTTTTGGGSGS
jgi:type II secretion system protein I